MTPIYLTNEEARRRLEVFLEDPFTPSPRSPLMQRLHNAIRTREAHGLYTPAWLRSQSRHLAYLALIDEIAMGVNDVPFEAISWAGEITRRARRRWEMLARAQPDFGPLLLDHQGVGAPAAARDAINLGMVDVRNALMPE